MHKKIPWKTVKMAPIYDFPRAARAEHGHGAKKVLAGVRFQWTDTQNDICISRAEKFSGWEPRLEPSKPFLLLFERAPSHRWKRKPPKQRTQWHAHMRQHAGLLSFTKHAAVASAPPSDR